LQDWMSINVSGQPRNLAPLGEICVAGRENFATRHTSSL